MSGGHQNHNNQLVDHPAHAEEGEGAWLISYADLMTLLVGFFVILLSFSTVDQEKFEEAAKSVTKEFGGVFETPFADIAKKIIEALKKAGVGDQISVKTNPNGVDISFLGTAFFSTGSADFRPEAKNLFDELIPTIKPEAATFDIVVEGHTDDVPLASGAEFRNNFELSSIRACRVLDYFTKSGFDPAHTTAIGYGETRPVVPNRDKDGNALPENQSQNRRVIIKLTKRQKASL